MPERAETSSRASRLPRDHRRRRQCAGSTGQREPRREAAQEHLREWIAAGEDIHAPALLPYEVANSLTRVIASGLLPSDRAAAAWQSALSLPITYHPLQTGGNKVIETALRLQRHSAYDAAYLELAEQLDAELWTFDGPLA